MTDGLRRATEEAQQVGGMDLCLTCFGLRGELRGRTHKCRCQALTDDWRERGEWAGYDIPLHVEVCRLCVRGTMKSGSRWSSYACTTCLELNLVVGRALGSDRGALPLGRHSLMNGVGLRASEQQTEGLAGLSAALMQLVQIWVRLADWKVEEGQRLTFDTVWERTKTVRWHDWSESNPVSPGASVDAYCRFVEYDLPEHPVLYGYISERARFHSGR